MANWITQTNIENAISAAMLIKLLDDTNDPPTTVNPTILAALIADAESQIQSKLMNRYPAQCAAKTASTLITSIGVAIVIRQAYVRRQDMAMTQVTLVDIQAKLQILEKLVDGSMGLPEWAFPDQVLYANNIYDANAPDSLEDWLINREEEDIG